MYLNAFHFHQPPFSIAPNPAMLFPSQRHQEAIGYLSYGLQGQGGFVMLTGEVGTGKTMVSRSVLADLADDVKVAYILNPTLSSIELLESVCEAFAIENVESGSHKSLSNGLQQFLMTQYQQGNRCVLVIDEAQHLSSDALEQLRLFTNLETNERKLLQIILIGQPELQEKLNQRELRQLAQRITARYHLLPFTATETHAYIQHRLVLAGGRSDLFDSKAIKLIYQASSGTPRLINLMADRALMGAYALNSSTVTANIAKQAISEVMPNRARDQQPWSQGQGGFDRTKWLVVSAVTFAVIGVGALLVSNVW